VSITTDPILLLYEADEGLPEKLDPPLAGLVSPQPQARREAYYRISIKNLSDRPEALEVILPPKWSGSFEFGTRREGTSLTASTYRATPPVGDTTREAEFIVRLGNRGELYHRVKIVDGDK
jgi:hypothetical protein